MFPGRPPIILGRNVRPVVAKGIQWIKSNPLVAKAVPTAFGFAFGDILTQAAQQRASGSFSLDMKKTMVMLIIGATVAGPMGLAILQLPGDQPSLIGLKLLADQVVGCIIWQATYICISSEYKEGAVNVYKSIQNSLQDSQALCKLRLKNILLAS
ncbi:hypothetical protein CEUSTIGMA_g1395.t1 [Chlamydomonas eustigma]|uniref:Uncharacterized protein n=1 Tax=Chlamydomonas eustigma TaxID=1157962 RepID=A0A250WSZ4_9CHLO|nr:hypothetical protein CEUSTIGMA_g1395.t1 [Chlamydomonas eustigma]|eukprot:GAX73945.1 hypothetical protein CEUSTIGMA_g1395.t1 [Chlamydomonas eustigma]